MSKAIVVCLPTYMVCRPDGTERAKCKHCQEPVWYNPHMLEVAKADGYDRVEFLCVCCIEQVHPAAEAITNKVQVKYLAKKLGIPANVVERGLKNFLGSLNKARRYESN